MLKHFRSCVSAEVEQLCLLAKLWPTLAITQLVVVPQTLISLFQHALQPSPLYYFFKLKLAQKTEQIRFVIVKETKTI